MGTRRLIAGGLAGAALATATVVPSTASATDSRVLLDGLSSPKGIAIAGDQAVIVAQGAFGPPGPVLRYDRRAPHRRRVTEITEPFNITDVAISPLDDTGWAISEGVLFHQLADGEIVPVLDLIGYQVGDPDPADQDPLDDEGPADESNPYGLTVMRNGDALVADAAGNDVLRVTPDGSAFTLARFDVEAISTDHLPGYPEPAVNAEAVPTSVVVGPDGYIYVGQLKGFPFRPGTARVWRIDPNAAGAWCSVNSPSAACTPYVSGLTAIQDIAFDHRTGRLYVYELAADGVLAFEAGLEPGGVFPPAVLLEIRHIGRRSERRSELAAGDLSQPGGVAVGRDGRIYVTDGIFTSGRLIAVTH